MSVQLPVVVGAEPFAADGTGETGRVGVLVSHGFTGSPFSMRPWAQHLADAGYTVRLPRLPGHGTRWRELNTTSGPTGTPRCARPTPSWTTAATPSSAAGCPWVGR